MTAKTACCTGKPTPPVYQGRRPAPVERRIEGIFKERSIVSKRKEIDNK